MTPANAHVGGVTNTQRLWHLKGFDLFQGLEPEALSEIERASAMRRVRKGAILYLPGDPSDRVYALRQGFVKLGALSADGREATLALLEKGEVFGEIEVIEGIDRAHIATVQEESVICSIPRALFLQTMKRHGDFAFKVTVRLGQRVQEFHSKVACLLFKGAQSRLAELLLELAKRYGDPTAEGIRLRYKFSHRELASLIGVARETVSYTLGELRRAGCIASRGGHIVMLEPERLAQQV